MNCCNKRKIQQELYCPCFMTRIKGARLCRVEMLILCECFSLRAFLTTSSVFRPYQRLTGRYCGQCLTANFRGQASLSALYGPAFHPILGGDKGQAREKRASGFGLTDKLCRTRLPPSPLVRRPLWGPSGHKFSGH